MVVVVVLRYLSSGLHPARKKTADEKERERRRERGRERHREKEREKERVVEAFESPKY